MNTKDLVERLEKFPQLKERFEKLLVIAENKGGLIELADDAEEMILMANRGLSRDLLQCWAESQAANKSQEFEQRHQSAHKEIKKKCNGTPVSEI